jgi:hypothetical protein
MWAIIEAWCYVVVLVSAATVGVLAMWVTFNQPITRRAKIAWLSIFSALSLIGITAAIVDHRTSERENKQRFSIIDSRVNAVETILTTATPRPTAEEQAALAKRVAALKRKTGRDLKNELQLMPAEILQFVAEREAAAPEVDATYFQGPQIYELSEMMNQPLNAAQPSPDELIERMHRQFQMKPADFKVVAPNEQDSLWIEKNLPSIQYYYQTRILFGKRFGARIRNLVCGSDPNCGGRKMDWCVCKEVAARVRAANEPVYVALKQWNATGVEPANLDELLKARKDAGDFLFSFNELVKKYDEQIHAAGGTDAPIARAVWHYPTNLIAMRTLAKQMEALANQIP